MLLVTKVSVHLKKMAKEFCHVDNTKIKNEKDTIHQNKCPA
jgi:hypothetical protein